MDYAIKSSNSHVIIGSNLARNNQENFKIRNKVSSVDLDNNRHRFSQKLECIQHNHISALNQQCRESSAKREGFEFERGTLLKIIDNSVQARDNKHVKCEEEKEKSSSSEEFKKGTHFRIIQSNKGTYNSSGKKRETAEKTSRKARRCGDEINSYSENKESKASQYDLLAARNVYLESLNPKKETPCAIKATTICGQVISKCGQSLCDKNFSEDDAASDLKWDFDPSDNIIKLKWKIAKNNNDTGKQVLNFEETCPKSKEPESKFQVFLGPNVRKHKLELKPGVFYKVWVATEICGNCCSSKAIFFTVPEPSSSEPDDSESDCHSEIPKPPKVDNFTQITSSPQPEKPSDETQTYKELKPKESDFTQTCKYETKCDCDCEPKPNPKIKWKFKYKTKTILKPKYIDIPVYVPIKKKRIRYKTLYSEPDIEYIDVPYYVPKTEIRPNPIIENDVHEKIIFPVPGPTEKKPMIDNFVDKYIPLPVVLKKDVPGEENVKRVPDYVPTPNLVIKYLLPEKKGREKRTFPPTENFKLPLPPRQLPPNPTKPAPAPPPAICYNVIRCEPTISSVKTVVTTERTTCVLPEQAPVSTTTCYTSLSAANAHLASLGSGPICLK